MLTVFFSCEKKHIYWVCTIQEIMASLQYGFMLMILYLVCSKAEDTAAEFTCFEVIANKSYNCEDLGLQEIPKSLPPTTEILDFGFNSLFALYRTTFSDLINLRHLDLTRCNINWIYEEVFKKNMFLHTIVLIGNPIIYISDMAFDGPIFLKHLLLQQTSINHLTYFPTTNLDNLETLSFGNNFLTSMQFPKKLITENVKTLDFQSNAISKIFTKDLEVLKEVNNFSLILKSNNIEYIEPNAFNSSILYSLDLTGCAVDVDLSVHLNGLRGLTTNILKIGTFEEMTAKDLEESSLNGLCNISFQELNLQFRRFSDLSNSTFFCLSNAKKIDLTQTHIDNIPITSRERMWTELVLNKNDFQSLCDINSASFPLLTHLHIVGNSNKLKIEDGCLKSLSHLQYLDLSHSSVRTDSCCRNQFMGLISLKHLNLSFNNENNFLDQAFPESGKLEVLDISHSYLFFSGSLNPFSNLKLLRVLNMSYSRINASNEGLLEGLQSLVVLNMKKSSFQSGIIRNHNLFQNVPNLEVLILSSCDLTAIEENAFHKLQKLSYIDLSFNKLTVFYSYVFKDLRNIYLNFAFNSIQKIPVSLVKNITDKTVINLSYNPLDCSCENIQFISWYKQNTEKFEDNKYTVCESPPPTVGIEMSRLKISCSLSTGQIFLIIIAIFLVIICVVLAIRCYRKRNYFDI